MEFPISQSKLADYTNLCPMEFKAKHITKEYPDFEGTEAMSRGNIFETLAIGGGINGAVTVKNSPFGAKIERSEYYPRIVAQAKFAKQYLKEIGGTILRTQEYIKVPLTSRDGLSTMWIEGTLDIRYRWTDGRMVVIDLKFTGNTENQFGKFSWGNPERMDLTQIIHYCLLLMVKYELDYIPVGYYWVFDHEKAMKQKLIRCNISQETIDMHIDRLFEAHNQIQFNLAMDSWQANNTWENCSKCKAKCMHERKMPEYHEINL